MTAKVFYADLWGSRPEKYQWLVDQTAKTTQWEPIEPTKRFYLFKQFDCSEIGDYDNWPSITNVMPVNSVGIVTARDHLTIQWSRDEIWQVVNEFVKFNPENARIRFDLGRDARDWKISFAQEDLCRTGPSKSYITPLLYRPFDTRFTYYTDKSRGFLCMPRGAVMSHMLAGENLAIISCRQQARAEQPWTQVSVTNHIAESCAISNITREINYIFPLYLYPDVGKGKAGQHTFDPWPEGKDGRQPNLDPKFVQEIEKTTGLTFLSDGRGNLEKTFGPEDVLAYIYAVFHWPEYRRRYEPMLKIDFPRIPPPKDAKLFVNFATAGHDLLSLHLLESSCLDTPLAVYEGQVNPNVEKVSYADETVWLDKAKTCGFKGVPEEVWNFHIGGYQVCEKWLKNRQTKGGKNPRPGRILTEEDINHYQKIIVALSETIRTMKEINEIVETHDDWPDAFVTNPKK